ncbi:alanyl-tRNA editing protein [Agathobacter sp.]
MSMTETIKLYDRDAYATEFEADIIFCEPNKANDKRFDIILNQTLFFPEEGGQSPDMGILGGYRVVDVQIKNGVITHTVDTSAGDCCEVEKEAELAAGVHVQGKIDWQHRFYNMQQHSGEHIFSGIVHSRFGFENVGFHLSDSVVTMDFSGVISPEDIAEVEHEVNVAISKNIPIEVTYPSRDELAQLEYRSKIEIEGQVRIVTVPGYDVCACCAPHVKRTGEIGMLKVMNYQNYKGGVRVSILCGFRALEAFRQKCDIISELMGIFTTNQEAIVDNVTKLKAVNQSLKSELGTAKAALLDYKVAELPTDTENAVLFEGGIDTNTARNCVNALVEKYSGFSAFFMGNDEDGYSFIIGSKNADCNTVAAALRNKLGARGGGKPVMVQGSVKAVKREIEEVLKEVL